MCTFGVHGTLAFARKVRRYKIRNNIKLSFHLYVRVRIVLLLVCGSQALPVCFGLLNAHEFLTGYARVQIKQQSFVNFYFLFIFSLRFAIIFHFIFRALARSLTDSEFWRALESFVDNLLQPPGLLMLKNDLKNSQRQLKWRQLTVTTTLFGYTTMCCTWTVDDKRTMEMKFCAYHLWKWIQINEIRIFVM